jgi:ABC-type uncharacterized transport system ATPase subunit
MKMKEKKTEEAVEVETPKISDEVREYSDELIEKFDVRTSAGSVTVARTMSGGNQQKAIIAREIDSNPELLIAVQPTRGLDVGAIEYVHKQIVAERDKRKAVLLVSFEFVMNLKPLNPHEVKPLYIKGISALNGK